MLERDILVKCLQVDRKACLHPAAWLMGSVVAAARLPSIWRRWEQFNLIIERWKHLFCKNIGIDHSCFLLRRCNQRLRLGNVGSSNGTQGVSYGWMWVCLRKQWRLSRMRANLLRGIRAALAFLKQKSMELGNEMMHTCHARKSPALVAATSSKETCYPLCWDFGSVDYDASVIIIRLCRVLRGFSWIREICSVWLMNAL